MGLFTVHAFGEPLPPSVRACALYGQPLRGAGDKKSRKYANVIYGWPLLGRTCHIHFVQLLEVADYHQRVDESWDCAARGALKDCTKNWNRVKPFSRSSTKQLITCFGFFPLKINTVLLDGFILKIFLELRLKKWFLFNHLKKSYWHSKMHEMTCGPSLTSGYCKKSCTIAGEAPMW